MIVFVLSVQAMELYAARKACLPHLDKSIKMNTLSISFVCVYIHNATILFVDRGLMQPEYEWNLSIYQLPTSVADLFALLILQENSLYQWLVFSPQSDGNLLLIFFHLEFFAVEDQECGLHL